MSESVPFPLDLSKNSYFHYGLLLPSRTQLPQGHPLALTLIPLTLREPGVRSYTSLTPHTPCLQPWDIPSQ